MSTHMRSDTNCVLLPAASKYGRTGPGTEHAHASLNVPFVTSTVDAAQRAAEAELAVNEVGLAW